MSGFWVAVAARKVARLGRNQYLVFRQRAHVEGLIGAGTGRENIGTRDVQCLEQSFAQRRKGLSRAALSALLRRGQEAGATGACLQVVADNHSAIRLYESLGFANELYRYHYRVR